MKLNIKQTNISNLARKFNYFGNLSQCNIKNGIIFSNDKIRKRIS